MKRTLVLKRYAGLYLPPLILGGLFVHIALEGLIPALDGEIPAIRGVERTFLLAENPGAFWYQVTQRIFMLVMAPLVAVAWAFMRKSDHDSDGAIRARADLAARLDKAVRRPLEP